MIQWLRTGIVERKLQKRVFIWVLDAKSVPLVKRRVRFGKKLSDAKARAVDVESDCSSLLTTEDHRVFDILGPSRTCEPAPVPLGGRAALAPEPALGGVIEEVVWVRACEGIRGLSRRRRSGPTLRHHARRRRGPRRLEPAALPSIALGRHLRGTVCRVGAPSSPAAPRSTYQAQLTSLASIFLLHVQNTLTKLAPPLGAQASTQRLPSPLLRHRHGARGTCVIWGSRANAKRRAAGVSIKHFRSDPDL